MMMMMIMKNLTINRRKLHTGNYYNSEDWAGGGTNPNQISQLELNYSRIIEEKDRVSDIVDDVLEDMEASYDILTRNLVEYVDVINDSDFLSETEISHINTKYDELNSRNMEIDNNLDTNIAEALSTMAFNAKQFLEDSDIIVRNRGVCAEGTSLYLSEALDRWNNSYECLVQESDFYIEQTLKYDTLDADRADVLHELARAYESAGVQNPHAEEYENLQVNLESASDELSRDESNSEHSESDNENLEYNSQPLDSENIDNIQPNQVSDSDHQALEHNNQTLESNNETSLPESNINDNTVNISDNTLKRNWEAFDDSESLDENLPPSKRQKTEELNQSDTYETEPTQHTEHIDNNSGETIVDTVSNLTTDIIPGDWQMNLVENGVSVLTVLFDSGAL